MNTSLKFVLLQLAIVAMVTAGPIAVEDDKLELREMLDAFLSKRDTCARAQIRGDTVCSADQLNRGCECLDGADKYYTARCDCSAATSKKDDEDILNLKALAEELLAKRARSPCIRAQLSGNKVCSTTKLALGCRCAADDNNEAFCDCSAVLDNIKELVAGWTDDDDTQV